jgi:hypothetical protein
VDQWFQVWSGRDRRTHHCHHNTENDWTVPSEARLPQQRVLREEEGGEGCDLHVTHSSDRERTQEHPESSTLVQKVNILQHCEDDHMVEHRRALHLKDQK